MSIFHRSISQLQRVCASNPVLLLAAFVFIELTQHHFTNLTAIAITTQSDTLKFLAAMGKLTGSLIEFLFLAMLVPLRVMEHQGTLAPDTFWGFTKKHIVSLTSEGIRALGVVLLWSILLIIPGIFKYIRLFFVPYVVVADPEYIAGHRDALKFSNDITKGFSIQLFMIIVAWGVYEYFRDEFRTNYPLLQSPSIAMLGGALFFVISIYINILVFKIYQNRVKSHSARSNEGG